MGPELDSLSAQVDTPITDSQPIEESALIPCQGITSMGTTCGRMSKTGWCHQHGPTL